MINPNEDYYAWTQETAEKLRQGRLNEVNREDLIEDIGASVWRTLDSCLIILLAHLPKWQYQPERKGKSWRLTIEEQRYQITRLLKKNPSLKPALEETLGEAYPSAVRSAAK